MPIYEYQCRDCRSRFELLRSIREGDSAAPCPTCGSVHTSRQLSVIAPTRNGGGDDSCGWDAAAGACFKGG